MKRAGRSGESTLAQAAVVSLGPGRCPRAFADASGQRRRRDGPASVGTGPSSAAVMSRVAGCRGVLFAPRGSARGVNEGCLDLGRRRTLVLHENNVLLTHFDEALTGGECLLRAVRPPTRDLSRLDRRDDNPRMVMPAREAARLIRDGLNDHVA